METEEQNPAPISRKLMILNALLVLSVLAMAFLIYFEIHRVKEAKKEKVTIINSAIFNNLKLEGKAVYVFDVSNNRVLFQRNEKEKLPLASITKLMTALTAVELLPGNIKITIRDEFLKEEGDSGLLNRESWNLLDLLDYSLVVSSNDGARSISSVIGSMDIKNSDFDLGRKDFIMKMNQEAQKLNLKQTYFINESGLDEGNVSGGYGSAEDMGKLMNYILTNKPEILEATKYTTLKISSANYNHIANNTNLVIDKIPGIIASKTGFTDMAGGNLVVAFDASIGHPIIVVVLGSTQDGRFTDVDKLVQATLKFLGE